MGKALVLNYFVKKMSKNTVYQSLEKNLIYEEMKDIRTKELIIILSINQRTKFFLNQAISFKCLCLCLIIS